MKQLQARAPTGYAALLLMVCVAMGVHTVADAQSTEDILTLNAAISNFERSSGQADRDPYRHPAETLAFFGIRPDMTVVELWPGGGWYTEILAPYLAERGRLYLAHFSPHAKAGFRKRLLQRTYDWLESRAYRHVEVTTLSKGHYNLAPAGTADLVLTFRNLHNWLAQGYLEEVFQASYRALKPGGILGIVEHRAPEGRSMRWMNRAGYVSQSLTVDMAKKAGFKLLATSEINANPKDTKDYARGVWTLPPRLIEGDTDRDIYLGIGESDRMTLKFIKP